MNNRLPGRRKIKMSSEANSIKNSLANSLFKDVDVGID